MTSLPSIHPVEFTRAELAFGEAGLTIRAVADSNEYELPPLVHDPLPSEQLATLDIHACAIADENYREPKPRRPPTRALRWKGEAAESLFEWRATSLNLVCAKPTSDCLPYDRVILTARNHYRVQIKNHLHNWFDGSTRGYRIPLWRSNRNYRKGDFDFLAARVPGDTWYIIPFQAVEGRTKITLPGGPSKKRNRFAQYREAWHLFE